MALCESNATILMREKLSEKDTEITKLNTTREHMVAEMEAYHRDEMNDFARRQAEEAAQCLARVEIELLTQVNEHDLIAHD